MSDEKTEEPTPKKLEDSRRKGQVWKSRDLTSVFTFLVGLGVLKGTWSTVEEQVTELFRFSFAHLAHPEHLETATSQLMLMGLTTVLTLTLPVVAATAVVGALLDFLQVGSLFTLSPLMPRLDKLNPIQGMKNLVSKKQLVELLKNLVKLSTTGYVTFGVVREAMPLVVETVRRDTQTMMAVMGELVFRVSLRVGLVFLLFAIFDVWWQRKSFMKDMMMSKEEVKREYKESEGDPHQKARRKEMAHELLEGAQLEAVKDADVIVTNPDHVAVALKYDQDKDAAPRVLAKGLDFKAERIKSIARGADVPTLRNVPLAHALLRIDVGHEIPEELYDAVAEVLNFVYGLRSEQCAGGSR